MSQEKREQDPISFELNEKHRSAIDALAGGRRVRLSGRVVGGKMVVDFVACNAPFVACNAAFTACNAAFSEE
jgi:hypothetical protein